MWHYFFLGYFVGGILCSLILLLTRFKCVGTLRIDRSNPEKDIYQIVVGDFDKLSRTKQIVLKIDNNADLSQN
jgi:hypothetical protein